MSTTTTSETFKFNTKAAGRYLSLIEPDTDAEFDFRAIGPDWLLRKDQKPPRSVRGSLSDDKVVRKLKQWNRDGRAIFVTVNRTNGQGVKAKDIVGVRVVFADLDRGMPPKGWPLEPSFVIETSPGKFQAYWLVCGEMTGDQFAQVMERMVRDYGGDPGAKDIARVLRVPGFWHQKDEDNPFRVRFFEQLHDIVPEYTADELLKRFPPLEQKAKKRKGADALATLGLTARTAFDPDEVRSALEALPPELVEPRDEWLARGQEIHHGSEGSKEGFELWCEWASSSDKFDDKDALRVWKSFSIVGSNGDPRTLGSLYHLAKEHGWSKPNRTAPVIALPPDAHEQSASEFGVGVDEWSKENTAELLTRMNKEHALVSIGSKVRYLHRAFDPEGRPELRFLLPEDMKRLYANVVVDKRGAFEAWDRWRHRQQFTGLGMFPPGANAPRGYLNLWTGFTAEPCEGDWSLFRSHLREIVCGDDAELFTWLMDWLAHIIQKPHEKPGSAIVLRSKRKGTGKSMLLEILRRILGVHVLTTPHSEHVVGKFNAHLARTLVLGIDEGVWAGSKAAEGIVKNLITEPFITVEPKNIDVFTTRNFTRLIFTSNESWVVPVGIDERRFCIFDVKNPKANDQSYFDPIFAQMDNGGVEAMMYELKHRTITSNLRSPPETRGLVEQRKHSLDAVERWVWMVAKNGELPNKETGGPIVLDRKNSTVVPKAVVIAAAKAACNQFEGRSIDIRLGNLLSAVGVDGSGRESKGERRRTYSFPPLPTFLASVNEELRI